MSRAEREASMARRSGSAEQFDAIVIGAGEAGTVVASQAVQADKRVAMIFLPPYGSTCLNAGCVPSKFLIHRARIAHQVRTARRFHIETEGPRVHFGLIAEEKDAMVEAHRHESWAAARSDPRLALVEGSARFYSAREVRVNNRRLSANDIFIATGLRPHVPDLPGLVRDRALTSDTVMMLTAIPEHLIVIGGGYVACELGQTFHRFGSRVTIIQSGAHLLAHEEPDVSRVLAKALREEGLQLLLGHKATRVEHSPSAVRVWTQPAEGAEVVCEGSHLLLATGRRPNTGQLGLDAAGVVTDQEGYVKVGEDMATSVPGIWGIGDVNGLQPFTRVCQEEAKVSYANAFEGASQRLHRGWLGHAVFTDPEIGSVGLTEAAARAEGHDVAVGLVTFDQVARARLTGETTGMIKYVVERQTHQVLGCHVIGPHAAELVYAAIPTMRQNGRLEEVAEAVGIFPTLQEGLEGAARGLMKKLGASDRRGPPAMNPVL